MNELEAKLKENKNEYDATARAIKSLESQRLKLYNEYEELKKQIAEEAKPKLKHGECFHDGCNSVVTVKGVNGWHRLYGKSMKPAETESSLLATLKACHYKPTGFMFPVVDDLKAMQEKVKYNKEYKFGHNKGLALLLDGSGDIHFRGDTGFWLKDATPVANMIRRMQVTHQRRKK